MALWLTTGPGALNLASGEGGKIGSLNSYGYTGLNYMFGPKFDSKAKSVYDTAKGMLN